MGNPKQKKNKGVAMENNYFSGYTIDNVIKIGDKVDIFFEHLSNLYNVTITYTPCGEGDSYEVVDEDNIPYRVQKFWYMKKIG